MPCSEVSARSDSVQRVCKQKQRSSSSPASEQLSGIVQQWSILCLFIATSMVGSRLLLQAGSVTGCLHH